MSLVHNTMKIIWILLDAVYVSGLDFDRILSISVYTYILS